jgi:hypothetical protein
MSSRNTSLQSRWRLALLALAIASMASPLFAQCTLQLSDEGIVRMNSGDERTLRWNAVPGASSYLVETLIEGLNEPSGPDFTFGGPYTESRNGEGRNLTQYPVRHSVLYKMRFRYSVTALNRENPLFQPCKDDVLYVVEPDPASVRIAQSRIIPVAGKTPGANGANFTTALVLSGTGRGTYVHPGEEEYHAQNPLYQGRIYFRPLGTASSDSDPSIPYRMHGDDTLVFDDIMETLGANGIGTIEVIAESGRPIPLADAIVENKLTDGRRAGVRIPGAWGRDLLRTNETVTIGIRNMTDARVAFGLRAMGGPGHVIFRLLRANGTEVEVVHRQARGDTTELFPLRELFTNPLSPGDRIIAGYAAHRLFGHDGIVFPSARGVVLFATETGNDFNTPNMVYLESMNGSRYERGFDQWVVY